MDEKGFSPERSQLNSEKAVIKIVTPETKFGVGYKYDTRTILAVYDCQTVEQLQDKLKAVGIHMTIYPEYISVATITKKRSLMQKRRFQ